MTTGLNTHDLFHALQPELKQLDEERITTRQAIRRVNLIWLPLFFIAVGLALWSTTRDSSQVTFYLVGFVSLILYAVRSVKKNNIRKGFAKSFKVKLIDKIVKKIDPSFTYKPDNTVFTATSKEPSI